MELPNMVNERLDPQSDLINGLRSLDQYSRLASLTLLRDAIVVTNEQLIGVRDLLNIDDLVVKTEAIMVLGLKGSNAEIAFLRQEVIGYDSRYVGLALVSLVRLGDIEFVTSRLKMLEQSSDPTLRYSIPEIIKALKKARNRQNARALKQGEYNSNRVTWSIRGLESWKGEFKIDMDQPLISIVVYGAIGVEKLSEQHTRSIEALNCFSSGDLWMQLRRLMTTNNFRSPVKSLDNLGDYKVDEIVLPEPYRKVSTVMVFRLLALDDEEDDLEIFWVDTLFIAFVNNLIADDPDWHRIVL